MKSKKKPAMRPETKRPQRPLPQRASLLATAKVNLVILMTLRLHGIGQRTGSTIIGSRSSVVELRPKPNRVSRVPELLRAFSPDTLAPAEVGPVTFPRHSLRLA